MPDNFYTQSLTRNDIAGIWGTNMSNEFDYIQSGVAPQIIWTDDGFSRVAYAYSVEGRRTLYDRPQEEWETPTRTRRGFAFDANGSFYLDVLLESGHMPQGYIRQTLQGNGTYTLDGDVVTLNYNSVVITTYNDLDNHYSVKTATDAELTNLPGRYFRMEPGDAYNAPRMTELVRQSDGSLVPDPNNPYGFEVERKAISEVIDPNVGVPIQGSLRNDVLYGTNLLDPIDGRDGNDLIIGGKGIDVVTGGAGSDRFMLSHLDAQTGYIVQDFNPTEDLIVFNADVFPSMANNSFLTPDQFAVGTTATTASHRVIYNSATGDILFDADGSGAGAAVMVARVTAGLPLQHQNFYTTNSTDTALSVAPTYTPGTPGVPGTPGTPSGPLPGGAGQDGLISGSNGNDRLRGTSLNDTLIGGDGNDRIVGGNGNDLLMGGTGNNTLTGGKGKDIFALEPGVGRSVITDFRDRQDKFGLTNGLTFGQLDIEQRGKNVLIREDKDVLAIVRGGRENQITAADFTQLS